MLITNDSEKSALLHWMLLLLHLSALRTRVIQQIPRGLRVRGHADRARAGIRRDDWQVKLAASQRVGAEIDIVVGDRELPAGGDVGADDLLRVLGPRGAVGAAALDALRAGAHANKTHKTRHTPYGSMGMDKKSARKLNKTCVRKT